MKSFKVLRVISSMDPKKGGPCQGIRNSIPELEKLNIINEVVTLDDASEPFFKEDKFIVHALGNHSGPWKYNETLLPWLKNNLDKYDVVIVHGLWLYHGYAVVKAIQFCRDSKGNVPKMFVMPHGMLDPYFQRAAGRKLKAIRNWLYWKFIEKNLVNGADGVLFTTQQELLLARESFKPYSPKNEINVGYGIGNPPVNSVLLGEAFFAGCDELRHQPYLLFLSRIHQKKGVDLLIKAYEILIADGKTDLPYLAIAGPGIETEYGIQLKKIIEENSELKRRIVFTGMLTGKEKWGAFYNCQAFILPSHQENFGISVAEALACGKPVLISDQINIWREIEGAKGGIVDGDTLKGIISLLTKWINLTASEKEDMSKNAKFTFENYFGIVPHVVKLSKAFDIIN